MGLSILVVDDEKVQRDTLTDILRVSGYIVYCAESKDTALEQLRTCNVDLVLTDFRMSGGSGIELAKDIQEHYPHIVSIIMTAYADVDSVIEGLRIGILDYILKPFDVDLLLQKIHNFQERRDALQRLNYFRQIESEGVAYPEAVAKGLKLGEAVKDFSRQHITRVMEFCGGDKKEATKILGLGLSSLYRKLDELELHVEKAGEEEKTVT